MFSTCISTHLHSLLLLISSHAQYVHITAQYIRTHYKIVSKQLHNHYTHNVIRILYVTTEYGDWDEDEIECLKEGLRKFGRAWGKIYREVGGRKTATQCKQFYDTHCAIDKLGLLQALADHSSMKVCNMSYCIAGNF
jgi:type I site-specific restriction endonuclease